MVAAATVVTMGCKGRGWSIPVRPPDPKIVRAIQSVRTGHEASDVLHNLKLLNALMRHSKEDLLVAFRAVFWDQECPPLRKVTYEGLLDLLIEPEEAEIEPPLRHWHSPVPEGAPVRPVVRELAGIPIITGIDNVWTGPDVYLGTAWLDAYASPQFKRRSKPLVPSLHAGTAARETLGALDPLSAYGIVMQVARFYEATHPSLGKIRIVGPGQVHSALAELELRLRESPPLRWDWERECFTP